MKLTTWLKERELNCRRLAAGKTGSDRAGWIEDAEHFQAALAAVILFAAVAIIFVGSFGNQRLDLHVGDK